MYTNQITLSLLVVAAVSIPSSASASEYRDLCQSASKLCIYTGPNAPVLRAGVCLSSAGDITLKGTAPCPSDTWPYYVEYGEVVDPVTGQVDAYIPLDDACTKEGLCEKAPPPDGSQEFPMCCYVNQNGDEVCVDGMISCGGTLWFCHDGVSNEDGSITCFAAEQTGNP
jgi:hypothetical protein